MFANLSRSDYLEFGHQIFMIHSQHIKLRSCKISGPKGHRILGEDSESLEGG